MNDDLLQQLRGLAEPAAPGFWPPAPGWWLLAVLALTALVWLVRAARQQHRKGAPARFARSQLAALAVRFKRGELQQADYIDEVNALLKRVAFTGALAESARRAWGEPWLILLDTATHSTDFSNGPGRVLGADRYQAPSSDTFEPDRFAALVSQAASALSKRAQINPSIEREQTAVTT